MVQDALFRVMWPFPVSLWPVVAIQLAVALATRTGDARQEGFRLNEELVTVSAFNPSVVGRGKKSFAHMIIAWRAWLAALHAVLIIVLFVLDTCDWSCSHIDNASCAPANDCARLRVFVGDSA